ncbi:MAG: hypothetical protein K2O45_02725 [Oscillospiraceae bacterium]|nr:hypothetical protein [Oscillospiraceae bacterium]
MFDQQGRYVIRDYQSKPPFSSFLPGIAGPLGVPLWCYYNNRGQAVCSFGARDKDHAIMEFSPAHTAYQNVSRTGFRTFCKINGVYRELFTGSCDMHIGMSEVEIACREGGLEASALYFGVPGERTAALARVLAVRNAGETPVSLELLDGMPALVPYGVEQDALKNMANLAKAWMQVEDTDQGRACFRVRASMADTAQVTEVKGCNFCLGLDGAGTLLRPLVQPELVFGMDTSLARPEGFLGISLERLMKLPQVTENRFPCCFLPMRAVLEPGEEVEVFSLYGQAEDKGRVAALAERVNGRDWFEAKRQEAKALVDGLCGPIATKTGDPVFDAYCRQSYLDNLLRGGAPVFFESEGKKAPFYLYSRKHGDPEREYNYFSLGGEYYAQGNGNFRDVNQNRRCSVLFAPDIGAEDIHTFFDLIQSDGYNPLVVTASTYTLPDEALNKFLEKLPEDCRAQARALLTKPFTPGMLAMALEDWGMGANAGALAADAVCSSGSEPNATFSEGYWCDHWTYNLDLIESYLSVYPEQAEKLLFEDRRCRWYESRVLVNPRAKRYCMTDNGLRQYHALDEEAKADTTRKWMYAGEEEARSTLIEKLLLLCAVKTATLDAAGMGVEMEGGKPGWYDALNGLPGLLGSSMAESCELARLLAFTRKALAGYGQEISVYEEIAGLLKEVNDILQAGNEPYVQWDRMNRVKESYRAQTAFGFSGERQTLNCRTTAAMLERMERAVLSGIQKAVELGGGVCPTYFTYEATDIAVTPDGPMPLALEPHPLPLFLEGPVRWMKLDLPQEEKAALAVKVRESGLYDRELNMYKVNESLSSVSYEAGRALAFTPGWLENESIWLHMEYKYLLELLKSGLYAQFSEAFRAAAIPFLDPERYGRSPLENVSFLASSANPDPSVWGRGFVARLSGSTAEFLQMWQIMFFGAKPFRWDGNGLQLAFAPFVPAYLMPEDGVIEAAFLGGVKVAYHAAGLAELVPGRTVPVRWELTDRDGGKRIAEGPALGDRDARAVRAGQISEINITMK